MKLKAALLFLYAASAAAQTVTVTGTITDPDAQLWISGSYRIEFYPNPNYPNLSQYYVNFGGTSKPLSYYTTVFNGTLNTGGAFSQASIPQTSLISPEGSKWKLTFCPMASAPCSSITIPLNASGDITSTVTPSIIAPRFNAVYGTYGYNDAEAQAANASPGASYYNVIAGCQKNYNPISLSWACSTGGGGGSMIYPPAGIAKSTGTAWAASSYTDIVSMFASGSCTGYIKSDGTCDNATNLSGLTVNGLTVNHGATTNIIKTGDATLGNGNQTYLMGSLQQQNFYTLNSTYDALASMASIGGQQLRVILNGDSTTGFHNTFVACRLSAKFGNAGYDFAGLGGLQTGPSPCLSTAQGIQSSTGTVTYPNGASSIVPGTGAPYDFTRSPTGTYMNIASGGSITFASATGGPVPGNTLKVYYVKEPTDGVYNTTPGTMTVVASSSAAGSACVSGCTIFTGSTYNATPVGGVVQVVEYYDPGWRLVVSASGGAIDVVGTGTYDTVHNGIIFSSFGRGGMSLPDSVSTPAAVINPWYASATGASATINSWTCTSTTATFATSNQYFFTGENVVVGGLTVGASFGGPLTVLAAGLSNTQFEATVSSCPAASATESGYVGGSDRNALIMFEMRDHQLYTSYPSCLFATLANPGNLQPYTYWLNQYVSQWSSANPMADLEFIGGYDTGDTCIPVLNEAYREVSAANGYFYYDDWFPAPYTELQRRGQAQYNNVHSLMTENVAHSMNLVSQMGIDSLLGSEPRNTSNYATMTRNLYISNATSSSPVDPNQAGVYGVWNQNGTVGISVAQKYAASRLWGDSSLDTHLDLSNYFAIWNWNHSGCLFSLNPNNNTTAPCSFSMQANGEISHGSSNGQVFVSTGSNSGNGQWSWNYNAGGNTSGLSLWQNGSQNWIYWTMRGATPWWTGLPCCGSQSLSLAHDNYTSRDVILLPTNTMPASSISGNANGATAITQATTDSSTNIATDAFVKNAIAGGGGATLSATNLTFGPSTTGNNTTMGSNNVVFGTGGAGQNIYSSTPGANGTTWFGSQNTIVGSQAGKSLTSGADNDLFGYQAGYTLQGGYSTGCTPSGGAEEDAIVAAFGENAAALLNTPTSGQCEISSAFFGQKAAGVLLTSYDDAFFGVHSGTLGSGVAHSSNSTCIGGWACGGTAAVTLAGSTFVGTRAGNGAGGTYNADTGVGQYALAGLNGTTTTNAQYNTAIGNLAGCGITTGNGNTMLGEEAGGINSGCGNNPITGSYNIGLGYQSIWLQGATTISGSYNIIEGTGWATNPVLSSGSYNTMLGYGSHFLGASSGNVLIGTYDFLQGGTSGETDNIIIGYGSGTGAANLTNTVILGHSAAASASGAIELGAGTCSGANTFCAFGNPIANNTGVITASLWQPSVIYSAAGTALPTCNTAAKGLEAVVSDATSPTYLGNYTSGGAVTAPVLCNGTNWVTH